MLNITHVCTSVCNDLPSRYNSLLKIVLHCQHIMMLFPSSVLKMVRNPFWWMLDGLGQHRFFHAVYAHSEAELCICNSIILLILFISLLPLATSYSFKTTCRIKGIKVNGFEE